MKKRIVSIFLIICMVVGLMPISVAAEEGTPGFGLESFTTQTEENETATPSEATKEPEVIEEEPAVVIEEPEVNEVPEVSPMELATPVQALLAEPAVDIEIRAAPLYTFNAAEEGYGARPPYYVSIVNNGTVSSGDLSIELSEDNDNCFLLSQNVVSSIGVGATDGFSIAPITGLTTGTYSATITVSGSKIDDQSFDVSFTVVPAGTLYSVKISTYFDNVPTDMEGEVELRTYTSSIQVPWVSTGYYETEVANGTYDVYINGEETNKIISVSNNVSYVYIDYYTVNFSAAHSGTATGSTITATAGGKKIESGAKVVRGTSLTITASGSGAGSYTYLWSGSGTSGQTTDALTITNLTDTINAVCDVVGIGLMPDDPDYEIGDNRYLWTGTDQTIILSGSSETLTIHKTPSAVIKIEVQSDDGSTVTIEGNSVSCESTYIEVINDITLNLEDLDITAPAKTGLENNGLLLSKNDKEADQMVINIGGTCNIAGFGSGSAIRSIHDQNLLITGSGTLNVYGGSPTVYSYEGGSGIYMEAYTYADNQGAMLTIDGGVTVNAEGGANPENDGGAGIKVTWGDIFIGDAEVNAIGGESGLTYGTGGFAIQASYPSVDHSKGGNITIEDGSITAMGGDSHRAYGGRGLDAFNKLTITGGTVVTTGGNSENGVGGTAVYGFEEGINITGGNVTATGGNGNTNSSLGLYSLTGDINLAGGTINVTGGDGEVNGSHAVYAHSGSIIIENGANVTATGGNGTTGVGGVGLRAYGDSSGAGMVNIAADAGDVFIRGGKGAAAERDSVMGKKVYASTGNIKTILMETGSTNTIKNEADGDDVYRVKATADPAAEVVITSEVNGSLGSYTYRAVTKEDGVAYMWLPKGSRTLSSAGYETKTIPLSGDNNLTEVTLQKPISTKVPGAPQNVTAVPGDGKAVVSFSPPADNGGSSNLIYVVTTNPGGRTFTGTGSPITVTGLTNGVSYTFTVTASNEVGTGPASAPSAPVTPKAAITGTYTVSGRVEEESSTNPVADANVVVKKGRRQMGSGATDEAGNFVIPGIPNGTYNLIVTKGGKVVTLLIIVDDENFVFGDAIKLPEGITNSLVDVQAGAPDIVVGNLEDQFTQEDKEFAQIPGNKVELKLVAGLRNGQEIKEDADKIKSFASGKTIGLYLDLSVFKTQTQNNLPGIPQRISILPDIIEIVLPLPENLQGKSGLSVHRVHNGTVQTLKNGAGDENGEYFIEGTDTITIYTKSFSTYSISYTGSNTDGGSSSGGSSENGQAVCSRWTGQPVMGREELSASESQNGKATINITEKAVLDAMTRAWEEAKAKGKTANGIGVSLLAKDIAKEQNAEFVLPQHVMKILTEKNVRQFELKSSQGSINLDINSIKDIRRQSTGDVSITMSAKSNLSEQGKTMSKNRPTYGVTARFERDGNSIAITTLGGGTAIYGIPYIPAEKEDTGYLYGVHVDEQGQETRIPGSAYDDNTKSVILSSNQFQTVGVGYTAPATGFTDISGHWAKEAMEYVSGRGLMSGTSDILFSPDAPVTRGMLAIALGRLAHADTGNFAVNSFIDVTPDSVLAPYADWANKKGILKATGNKQFSPDQEVTREEMASVLQAYRKNEFGCLPPVTRERVNYDDSSNIDRAYTSSVYEMQQAGIVMAEEDHNFHPKNQVTRAQASMMLHRLVKVSIDPKAAMGWAMNDSGKLMYYKDEKAYTGWLNDDGNGSRKYYYFTVNGMMVSGKWLKIKEKWYYFYADGTLAVSTRIDGYDIDENGAMKSE